MAATDSKPTLSSLKTPLSATYPSELRSPMVRSATTPIFATIKREEDIKTPITPPTAYLEFLKNLSPVLTSPVSTTTTSTSTSIPTSTSTSTSTSISTSTSASTSTSTSASASTPLDKDSPATSKPSSSSRCDPSKDEPPISAPPTKLHMVTIPPPSPFKRPHSARTPRLYIPHSPYSPAVVCSPGSGKSASSFSAMSPKAWDTDRKTARSRRVSVREVVTRTVTYSSTPVDAKAPQFPQIDPAPRGKRRKME